jgi:hypothetical protein
LENLLRCIKSDPALAAVGPYTNFSSGHQRIIPSPTYRGDEEMQEYALHFHNEEKYVDFLVFFCCLIRRDVWDRACGLDEDFGQGCFEDNLLCYRILDYGYKMKVCGNAYIHHYGSMTFQTKNPEKLKYYASLLARNQKIFLGKVDRYETISLCMIVSDKENPETFKRCIDSIYEWVDEICVVFSYQYFQNYSKLHKLEKVLETLPIKYNTDYVKWPDSFSTARNLSLGMATSRYIIWLDTDDFMKTPAGIRDLILKNPHVDVFKCKIISYTEIKSQEVLFHARIFRNNPKFRFTNRCHEDISYTQREATVTITDLVIEHYGNGFSGIVKSSR